MILSLHLMNSQQAPAMPQPPLILNSHHQSFSVSSLLPALPVVTRLIAEASPRVMRDGVVKEHTICQQPVNVRGLAVLQWRGA